LYFLTEVANNAAIAASAQGHHRLERGMTIADVSERIIAASPILEAFGNAQTLRNPNSSRFGKWMVLNFDRNNMIHSSNITSYLLEKSRVTQRGSKERNYHIFYQIIRGIGREQLIQWHIDPSTRVHKYLSQGDIEAPDLNDSKLYKETFQAFLKMGFSNDDIIHLFKIIMAILQLGDIIFQPTRDGEGSQITNPEIMEQIAEKLSVSTDILSYSLCNRTMESGKAPKKSIVAVPLNLQKAFETRDSLARLIYDKLFLDTIYGINMKSKDSSSQPDFTEAADRGIGLLDIFGFEIFVDNSFEQLCINYCNEMLQNHFNFVIFTAEKNLYDEEGVICETIEFRDNIEVMREIELSFKALDEETRIPRGSSKTWFDKLKRGVKMNHILYPTRKTGDIFTVRHYAGNVDYNPIGFMEKNSETLNNDLMNAMSSSSDAIVHRIFSR
jgi:myosin heavy subunit